MPPTPTDAAAATDKRVATRLQRVTGVGRPGHAWVLRQAKGKQDAHDTVNSNNNSNGNTPINLFVGGTHYDYFQPINSASSLRIAK